MTSIANNELKVLVLYSQKDRRLIADFLQHFRALERFAAVRAFSERDIQPGEDINVSLDSEIATAKIAVLILSPSFIASDSLIDIQLPKILARNAKGLLRVVPVLLKSCFWQKHNHLGNLAVLPADGAPIVRYSGERRAQIFVEVVTSIASVAEDICSLGERIAQSPIPEAGKSTRPSEPLGPPIDLRLPQWPDQVRRYMLNQQLAEILSTNPIVSVEGLPGAGKSHLVAASLQTAHPLTYGTSFWHEAEFGEPVDRLLALFETSLTLKGLSTASKTKELVHALTLRRACLVIDNFHNVDQGSYASLLHAAAQVPPPARVITISRTYLDATGSIPNIAHIEVYGFLEEEMKAFLAKRGLHHLSSDVIHRLLDKTDGLPLAASLFATLVRDANRDPDDLLEGNMLASERLKRWFEDLSQSLNTPERSLLYALSLCDSPFNIGLVRALTDKPNRESDAIFERIQQHYLVQRHSAYRWSVHHLIAAFCYHKMDRAQRQQIHIGLANYYLLGLRPHAGWLNKDEFLWITRACRQFQNASQFSESGRLLTHLMPTAKAYGYYELIIELASCQRQGSPNQDPWLEYHRAHCCLITGRLEQSLRIIEGIASYKNRDDPQLDLMIARLYAEILGTMGQPQEALNKLRAALSSLSPTHGASWNHARSIEAALLVDLGQLVEAATLTDVLLADATRRSDRRGCAVALTRSGIIGVKQGNYADAEQKLEGAVSLFDESGDARGRAWALSHLGLVRLKIAHRKAVATLTEAISIKADIGECSRDYFEFLTEAGRLVQKRGLKASINKEIRRLAERLPRSARGGP